MVLGVDDVSAIVGLASISFTTLQGCFKGFIVLSHARTCDREIANLGLRLLLTQIHLHLWAKEAGLLAAQPTLHVQPPLDRCVPKILKQISASLCDLRTLKQKYNLVLEETSEAITQVFSDDSALAKLKLRQLPFVQDLETNTTGLLRTSPKPWQKVRWVTVDGQQFRTMLDDVQSLINMLYQFLRTDGRTAFESRLDIPLRAAIMNNRFPDDLNLIIEASKESFVDALSAPARLRKKSLLSGLFGRRKSTTVDRLCSPQSARPAARDTVTNPSADPMSRQLKRLSAARLTLPEDIGPATARQLGYYSTTPVLVEWRDVQGIDWKKLEHRAAKFSTLLNEMAQYASFHSLPCLGFVKNGRTGQYGYVFDVSTSSSTAHGVPSSNAPSQSRPTLPMLQTLQEMLSKPALRPSLNMRVSYAVTLLETVLQLHTAGWLHKELRSENVLFIAHDFDPYSDHELLRSPLYVAGYVYARADDQLDFTEPLKSETDADLYRHPATCQGSLREPYCKSFDIFSIGCLLLELGLWRTIPDIIHRDMVKAPAASGNGMMKRETSVASLLTPPKTPCSSAGTIWSKNGEQELIARGKRELLTQFREDVSDQRGIVTLLQAQTGEAYTKVVTDCLNVRNKDADINLNKPNDDDDVNTGPDHLYAFDLEKRALDTLRGLLERL